MKIPEKVLISIDNIKNYKSHQLVIITTGSQGEAMSALSRMAFSEHKKVEITKGDLVIVSASPIPGNEKAVSTVINELFKKGADVVYKSLENIHVSGHACQEELKLILSLVKPKFFIPVHGEYRNLKLPAGLAEKMGMKPKNIIISDVGKTIEITQNSCKIGAPVASGAVLIDGLGVGDVGNIVLRDRQHLSENGLLVVVVTLEKYVQLGANTVVTHNVPDNSIVAGIPAKIIGHTDDMWGTNRYRLNVPETAVLNSSLTRS